MSLAAEKNDQSMEEILSSIRKIISEEDHPHHSNDVMAESSIEDEEPLVLTKIIHDDGNVVSLKTSEHYGGDTMTEENKDNNESIETVSEDAMELQAEQLVSDEASLETEDAIPVDEVSEDLSTVEELSEKTTMEDIVSNEALSQAAAALSSLTKLGEQSVRAKAADPVGGQTVEGLMREVLRPLLREWIDANLPSMVRVVVNEHVERIVRQMGHTSPQSSESQEEAS